ncbi:MAG: DMT family transporter [Candidatus Aenigmarchaeota archaeon]|nr:DMT family transporter [Candidatus Aenigmarchaeota archaeon]
MDKNLPIYFGLIIAALIWGSTFVAVKDLLKEMNPILLVFTRFAIASVIFLPLIKFSSKKTEKMTKNEFLKLILLGFFGITLLYIFQYVGVNYTTATISSVIIMFDPVIIIILSSIFLNEVFKKKKIIGVLLALLGSFILITNGDFNFSAHLNDFIGSFFVILGELCWCSYVILGKKILSKYSPMLVIGYSTIFGTIFLFPIAVVLTPIFTLPTVSLLNWTLILYLAVSGIVAYFFWFYALKKLYASKVSMFEYLIPVFSIIMAAIFLKEIITVYIVLGGVAVILGINLVQRDW